MSREDLLEARTIIKTITNLRAAIKKHGPIEGYVQSLESCFRKLEELRDKGINVKQSRDYHRHRSSGIR